MDPERIRRDIARYIAGDDTAGNQICLDLVPAIRAEVGRFLSTTDSDHDDVIQETLVGFLRYVRRAGQGPDRPEAFVVTMAGNRCRNLHRWRKRRPSVELGDVAPRLQSPGDDPSTALEGKDAVERLRRAFGRMNEPCRNLLASIYIESRPMEHLQREAGLSTVQGIYYRKYVCLRELARLLNEPEPGRRIPGSEGGTRQALSGERPSA